MLIKAGNFNVAKMVWDAEYDEELRDLLTSGTLYEKARKIAIHNALKRRRKKNADKSGG